MFCSNCGKEIPKNSSFCPECGASLSGKKPAKETTATASTSSEPKSRLVAGLLQILLGGLGIGRFYLGYTNIGVIQIVVTIFTCGIGSIWGLIDGILILAGNINEDADGNPLKD